MRWFTSGVVALGLMVGCSVPSLGELSRACVVDEDCDPIAVCEQSKEKAICVRKPDVIAPDLCEPGCLAHQVCTTEGCKQRFSAVKLREPADFTLLNGGTISIVAELKERYVTEAEWPALVFLATRSDGSPAGSILTPTRNGNTYTALWPVPSLDESVTVAVAFADANLRDTVTVRIDTTPPSFSTGIYVPPARTVGMAGVQADHRDIAAGDEYSFRRDEFASVVISSNDYTVRQVQVTVTGIGPDGGSGRTEAPVTVDFCPDGSAFCGDRTIALDLSVPEMRAFRGVMKFQVSGRDAAGNYGTSFERELRVTRWKWAFTAAGRIEGTPAVGNQGHIYFGTNTGTRAGKTFGIDQEGTKKWVVDSGDVIGSPAVGGGVGADEYVYVSAKTAEGSVLYALRGSGGEKARCSHSTNFDAPAATTVGIVGGLETAATIYNASAQANIARIQPDSAGGTGCLDISSSAIPRSISGAVVMKGQNIFYGTQDAAVASYDLSTESRRIGWPQIFPVAVPGLAIVGEQIFASSGIGGSNSLGGLSKISVEGGAVETIYPVTGSARVFNFAIGNGERVYFGAETTASKDLYSLSLMSGAYATLLASGVGTLRGAPVVGLGGTFYTVNTDGDVRAWLPDSTESLWGTKLEQGAGEATNISPTLDCLRDAAGQAVAGSRLGVLYVAADTKVYAFIVDSPGLDPDAPWPKYQHDARNTGNPATPISRCP